MPYQKALYCEKNVVKAYKNANYEKTTDYSGSKTCS